jgi:hypothetical protein
MRVPLQRDRFTRPQDAEAFAAGFRAAGYGVLVIIEPTGLTTVRWGR